MSTTLNRGIVAAEALFTTPVPDLSHPWDSLTEFDMLCMQYIDTRWPLPEFSHAQFLADHDHAAWLSGFDDLNHLLYVVNLERPWSIDRLADAPVVRWIACCDLCSHRSVRKKTQAYAETAAEAHAHNEHGWTPPQRSPR